MAAPRRLLAVAIAAGLSLAALPGCGIPAKTPASPATARPAKPAKPAKVPKVPMTVAFVSSNTGGRLYAQYNKSVLASLDETAQCPSLCGKYFFLDATARNRLLADMGISVTLSNLQTMADDISGVTATTYQGHPAFRAVAPGFGRGAYIIVSATAQCYPLLLVDPGQFELAFSQWNKVPVPVAPAPADIVNAYH